MPIVRKYMNSKEIRIYSEYKNVSSVCLLMKSFCEENSVPDDKIKEIELSLAEALNNIIKHSYKGNGGNKIDIKMNCSGEQFTIELSDYGESRKNLNKPVFEFDPNNIEALPEGGMGLFIIEKLMDENYYNVDGNKNTFTLVKYIN